MSQTPPTQSDAGQTATLPPRPAAATPAGDDPLAHLHKMSRTAGAGTQDYVAINPLAVTAAILGVASAVSLFGEIVFFVVPVLAIIFAVVAWRQIANSNGTQSGRPLAALGLVLALGFAGYQFTLVATEASRTRQDRESLTALTDQLGDAIADRKYDDAYALFTPRFQERVDRTRFRDLWEQYQRAEALGDVKDVRSSGLYSFEKDDQTGLMLGVGQMIVDSETSSLSDRPAIQFRKENDAWRIDDIPMFFPAPAPAAAPGGRS